VADLTPLAGLSGLQSLNCFSTQVADLTPLAGLSGLQSLICPFTKVADLTPLAGLSGLQSLICAVTQVADLTPLAGLSGLQSVDCSFTQVADLTPLAGLSGLQSVDCGDTEVADLTPLAGLSGLQSLDCSSTQVADLTPLVGLSGLQSLNCGDTQVADLTPLAGLSGLQSVDCSSTQVADLTPLAGLSGLQSLNCALTQVADLTPLAGLSGLQSLNCGDTQVEDLTPLLDLEKIARLEADHCRLADLPRKLLSKLTVLKLWAASIPGIPTEVLSRERYDDCLDRLRDHIADLERGSVDVRRAKLVVLGNGRVGKTQLCRILQGLPYDEKIPSTHGICVSNIPCPDLGPGEQLNLWDFGGQDIYHGTHALFMRTRALFVVVWSPDFEQAGEVTAEGIRFRNYPLSYWLDYVCTLGQAHSPVVVVQTRCDRPKQEAKHLPADVDAFEFLKPCWFSAKEGRGRAALLEAIRDGVAYMRECEGVSVIGKGRMQVIEMLDKWRSEDAEKPREKRAHRTLTRAQFAQLCQEVGGVTSPDSLLDYLHQLGVVFHLPKIFQDAIILDQSWALEAVYAVFEREKSYRQIASMAGRFTLSLLDMMVWSEYSSNEQRLFLSLMQSAGVCFLRRADDEKMGLAAEYVAPDLLPGREAVQDQLAGRWDQGGETVRIEFRYPFLHAGLMRGFICDAGGLARENGVYWRYGVWVYDRESGARALIEQRSDGRGGGSIVAAIQEGRPERLARWLRERFAEHNRRFGYADLSPAVDELPCVDEKSALWETIQGNETAVEDLRHEGAGCGPGGKLARSARSEAAPPVLGPMPAASYPAREPEVYISYAWGDKTPEGQRSNVVVDAICAALASKNVRIHRDAVDLVPGDRISDFMNRLIEGDLIVTMLSEKYLHSYNCMSELFGIYRRCGQDPHRFLDRIIPIVLPDARLSDPVDRIDHAEFWKKGREALHRKLRELGDFAYAGVEIPKQFRLVDEFARNVADMLTYINDKLFPRDVVEMEKGGFAEIVKLIGKGQKD
jgi:internalin A